MTVKVSKIFNSMKSNRKYSPLLFPFLALFALVGLSSCVPLAVGAAGGYMLKEEGYDVRSPITKD